MRLLLFFDLPVVTKTQKSNYRRFRKFLLNDGYDMIQWSVYGRIVVGIDSENSHLQRLKFNLPSEGSVRTITVTEKQYAEMRILVGEKTVQERRVKATEQLLLF